MSEKHIVPSCKSKANLFRVLGILTFSLLALCYFIKLLSGRIYILSPEFLFKFVGCVLLVVACVSGGKAIMLPGTVSLLFSEVWSYIPMYGYYLHDFHAAGNAFIYLLAPVLLMIATMNKKIRRLLGFIAAGIWSFFAVKFVFNVIELSGGSYYFDWFDFLNMLLLAGGSVSIAMVCFTTNHKKQIEEKPQENSTAVIEQLTHLKSLLDKGIITEEEFNIEKQKIMAEFIQ